MGRLSRNHSTRISTEFDCGQPFVTQDGSDDERKNRRLLEAISALGGNKRFGMETSLTVWTVTQHTFKAYDFCTSSSKKYHKCYTYLLFSIRKKLAERSEASIQVSEFTVNAEGTL